MLFIRHENISNCSTLTTFFCYCIKIAIKIYKQRAMLYECCSFLPIYLELMSATLASRLRWWNGYQSSIPKKEFPLWLWRIDLLYIYTCEGKEGFLICVEQTLYKNGELKVWTLHERTRNQLNAPWWCIELYFGLYIK